MAAARVSLLLLLALAPPWCRGDDPPPMIPRDAGPATPGCPDGGAYPCGPHGTSVGQVAADLSFSGIMDPDPVCKDPATQQPDLSRLQKMSFASWFQPVPVCAVGPGRRLLWVSVAAGWCPACSAEALDIQKMIKDGTLDRRVGLMGVLFETKTKGQAVDEAFLRAWINTYQLTYPVVMDPAFQMGAFYDTRETPFNMLLDLFTMRILYRHTGSNTAGLLAAIKSNL